MTAPTTSEAWADLLTAAQRYLSARAAGGHGSVAELDLSKARTAFSLALRDASLAHATVPEGSRPRLSQDG